MARLKRRRPAKISTVVGQQTTISGDVVFSGGLHLDGRINGKVTGEGGSSSLVVSREGVIEGDVRVDTLILDGTVIGDVYAAKHVELATRARVSGTVYYRLLEMAMGAEVNGKLVHDEELEQAAGKPTPAAAGTPVDEPTPVEGNS
jgi:cytoskeletal protein CcmA (bactofilin family)